MFGRDLGLASMTSLDTASTCFHLSILQSFAVCFSDRLCLVTLEIPAEIPSTALRGFVVVWLFFLHLACSNWLHLGLLSAWPDWEKDLHISNNGKKLPILLSSTDYDTYLYICLTGNNLSDNLDAPHIPDPLQGNRNTDILSERPLEILKLTYVSLRC